MQYQIRGFNVRGSCLIRENHEHLYPRNIPAIRYRTLDTTLTRTLTMYSIPLARALTAQTELAIHSAQPSFMLHFNL